MEELQDRQKAKIDDAMDPVSDLHLYWVRFLMIHAIRLRRLDDERHRKLENLRMWDRDCADAVAWLRNNQSRFKMEVFEAPMICCSVPDKSFTNAVEACFSATN